MRVKGTKGTKAPNEVIDGGGDDWPDLDQQLGTDVAHLDLDPEPSEDDAAWPDLDPDQPLGTDVAHFDPEPQHDDAHPIHTSTLA